MDTPEESNLEILQRGFIARMVYQIFLFSIIYISFLVALVFAFPNIGPAYANETPDPYPLIYAIIVVSFPLIWSLLYFLFLTIIRKVDSLPNRRLPIAQSVTRIILGSLFTTIFPYAICAITFTLVSICTEYGPKPAISEINAISALISGFILALIVLVWQYWWHTLSPIITSTFVSASKRAGVAASSVIVLILHIIVILGAGFISFILVDEAYHPVE
jgi:hypothetical protein